MKHHIAWGLLVLAALLCIHIHVSDYAPDAVYTLEEVTGAFADFTRQGRS